MTWALAVVDDGITDALQRRSGKATSVEYDFYYDFVDTDDGVAATHGNLVFQSALAVSRAYDVVDLKVAAAGASAYYSDTVERALQDVLANPERSIGAINLSFGGPGYPFDYADEIALLAARGVLCVASAGNDGQRGAIERPLQPAALAEVIAVGSHDGTGRPSDFSNNGPGVDLLADGEDMPRPGIDGTSFAAPRVAATVTHVQAMTTGLGGSLLDTSQMIDVLQQGGSGPLSRPDPADGQTRYFLHDHAGSLDYAWSRYGGSPARALEYVASYQDLTSSLGADAAAGRRHFQQHGSVEQRAITFEALDYIAAHGDLIAAFGLDEAAGAAHFIRAGRREGREVTFDGLAYIATYDDLIAAFGADDAAGTTHFIAHGSGEGRAVAFDGLDYIASYGDLILALGAQAAAGTVHFIGNGLAEGRARDLFDGAQYLANYSDLQAAFGTDEVAAAQHYISHGFFEERTDGASDFIV